MPYALTPAAVVESADTKDLKSFDRNIVPVQVRSAAPKTYRGVEQLVARRAHNPEVAGSKPATQTSWRDGIVQPHSAE